MSSYWLSIIIFAPLLGAAVVAGIHPARPRLARAVGFGFSLVTLALVILVWLRFDARSGEMQLVERHEWIRSLNVEYFLGLDGLSLLMVVLTALVMPFGLLGSWRIQQNARAYVALFLCLESVLLGAFMALNFFHWFIFYELSLVPVYFLIKLWGGPQRVHAATQFFVYTMVGSITMLLGFIGVYLATDTFDFIKLAEMSRSMGGLMSVFSVNLGWYSLSDHTLALLIFFGIFLGFAVKVPLMPFHTWQPVAYAEAPIGTTMVMSGVLSKLGLYGFLRILLPIFPEQMRMILTPLLWLAVGTIVFSALAAFAQRDLKRMIAYSSMNHLGYCLLGIFAVARLTGSDPQWATEKAAALNGVLLQIFNHGIIASSVFCFIGFMEHRSSGLRGLNDFGGLRRVAPVFCGLMGIAVFALVGLPGLNGFVGEFLIFKGSFSLSRWAASLSVIGLLVTAIFLLTLLQRVFHGPMAEKWSGFADLTWGERVMVVPAIILMFLVGIYPQLIVEYINPSVLRLVGQLVY